MHKFVSFNHKICLPENVHLSGVSSIALYGRGIFTTVTIYNSKPFLWEKHWARLISNAFQLNLDISGFAEESVKNSLLELISANAVTNGRIRLTFFDESAQGIWKVKNKKKTSLLLISADFRPLSKELKLTVSPHRINSFSPLINIKSCNYLENILAIEEAKKEGFDEAIRLNEKGEITSACMANIFWVKGSEIFTPSLKTGCLAGTNREFLLENHKVFEVEESIESLKETETIFLTSAGIGILTINEFEGKELQATLPPQLEPLPAVHPKQ